MNLIDINTPKQKISDILSDLGWIINESVINISSPGAGNMNVVLRITTDQRTFILKQSRPYVQKYQDIPAPAERIDTEYQFYKAIKDPRLDAHVPQIFKYDKSEHLIMMEDLGDCEDMSFIYSKRNIASDQLEKLVHIIKLTHEKKPPSDFPINMALRQLNHQHIFVLPFLEDNGFQLDDIHEGLQKLSLNYKKDDQLKSKIDKLGEQYLSSGDTLIHGDYYPGSWMSKGSDVYMLDPEFCFIGFKEFDLGVMIGHLILGTGDIGYCDKVTAFYKSPIDVKLTKQVAGVEIMRRLIGLAQLPLERSLSEKRSLLKQAYDMIMN